VYKHSKSSIVAIVTENRKCFANKQIFGKKWIARKWLRAERNPVYQINQKISLDYPSYVFISNEEVFNLFPADF